MNRSTSFLLAPTLSFFWFTSGCGGGPSGSTIPPPQNPLPVVTALTPSSVVVGSAKTPVSITGSGFITSSTVQWNGTALATTYGSAISLSATIPANDLASAAVAMLTVVNPAPGGGVSSAVRFSVNNPTPAISSVSPTGVLAGSSDTPLDIVGSGFVSSSVVAWNGTALTTTFVSATDLKATVPAADLTGSSADQISVQNPVPGGGSSQASAFTVSSPTPAIGSITPRYVPPGMRPPSRLLELASSRTRLFYGILLRAQRHS
jgi:hypothetical protein